MLSGQNRQNRVDIRPLTLVLYLCYQSRVTLKASGWEIESTDISIFFICPGSPTEIRDLATKRSKLHIRDTTEQVSSYMNNGLQMPKEFLSVFLHGTHLLLWHCCCNLYHNDMKLKKKFFLASLCNVFVFFSNCGACYHDNIRVFFVLMSLYRPFWVNLNATDSGGCCQQMQYHNRPADGQTQRGLCLLFLTFGVKALRHILKMQIQSSQSVCTGFIGVLTIKIHPVFLHLIQRIVVLR